MVKLPEDFDETFDALGQDIEDKAATVTAKVEIKAVIRSAGLALLFPD